jgi:hypothetical protein
MQKSIALLAFLLISFSSLFAQDATVNSNATPPPIVKPARDFLMLQFAYNTWIQKPDSVKIMSFNYVFNGYLCYDFPIKKSHFSFATGLGINANVVYLNSQLLAVSDTGLKAATARFIPDTANYKRYKFVTTYLQAPFELRYFGNNDNRNKGFKAALGLQVGTLLGAHTKGLRAVEGTNVKDKVSTKRYLSTWNFAATARIGWGNFSVFGSYNITPVFKDAAGPPITPVAVGICLTGL